MPNEVKFALPYPDFPEPDFPLMEQSTKDISRLAGFQTDKMSAVTEKAERVSSYALALQKMLGEELVSLSTKARNLDFRELFNQLTEIDQELAKGTLSAADTASVQEARKELVGVFAGGISDLKSKLRGSAAQVKKKVAEISAVVLAERTEETLNQRKQRQPELSKSIAEKRAAWTGIDADRSKIIAAQDVIRARNLIDTYKDLIPADLEKVDLKQPEAEAIRLGVEVLKKLMGEVSAGFKYADLADQRKALDRRIDQLDQDIRELMAEQKANDALISDLSAVMSIHEKRLALLKEANKLPTAFSGFADELDKLSGSSMTEANFNRLLGGLKSYLENCLESRNQVIIT